MERDRRQGLGLQEDLGGLYMWCPLRPPAVEHGKGGGGQVGTSERDGPEGKESMCLAEKAVP